MAKKKNKHCILGEKKQELNRYKHGILGEKKQELNRYIFEVINPKKLWKEEKPIYIAQREPFERA